MSEKPYRKYGASKGLPDFIKKRRKKMTEEKKEEEKKDSGKKYDGGTIPKLSKAAQREVEKESESK